MLDFTSSLYLGLQHPSGSLRPWRQFTTGAPAALIEPEEAKQIARDLAALMGCEAASLGTSTLHVAWDLFNLLAEEPITLFMDAEVYPIVGWGAQRAIMRGAAARVFRHHDVGCLRQALANAPRHRRPIIVTDGFCAGCGRVAPLRDYHSLARQYNGLLVADDTQAFGLLGALPRSRAPYGCGGGGSLRWSEIGGPEIISFSSLAKGFGVPLAVLGGSHALLREFKSKSLTRVHCSPPSFATLRSAEHAVKLNRGWGDRLRHRLASLVHLFRKAMHALGITASGGAFPIQTLELPAGVDAAMLHEDLEKRGLRTLLRRGRTRGRPQITLLLTAAHSLSAIKQAASMIAQELHSRRHAGDRQQFKAPLSQTAKTPNTDRRNETYERYIRT